MWGFRATGWEAPPSALICFFQPPKFSVPPSLIVDFNFDHSYLSPKALRQSLPAYAEDYLSPKVDRDFYRSGRIALVAVRGARHAMHTGPVRCGPFFFLGLIIKLCDFPNDLINASLRF